MGGILERIFSLSFWNLVFIVSSYALLNENYARPWRSGKHMLKNLSLLT